MHALTNLFSNKRKNCKSTSIDRLDYIYSHLTFSWVFSFWLYGLLNIFFGRRTNLENCHSTIQKIERKLRIPIVHPWHLQQINERIIKNKSMKWWALSCSCMWQGKLRSWKSVWLKMKNLPQILDFLQVQFLTQKAGGELIYDKRGKWDCFWKVFLPGMGSIFRLSRSWWKLLLAVFFWIWKGKLNGYV